MSNLALAPEETACGGAAETVAEPVRELHEGVSVALGGPRGMAVTRTLPNRARRMVGAWCFLDHYGPEDVAASGGMHIPPHPHTGLQTVSWLVSGEVLHRDSLGSLQLVTPGGLNLMTAGRGISHSEETPAGHSPTLHGVQLWVALPGPARDVTPHFEHHGDLPVLGGDGAAATVFLGELGAVASPAGVYTPLVGAEVVLEPGAEVRLPLRPDWEHAVLVLSGDAAVDGAPVGRGPLLYLGCGRTELPLRADRGARLLLLGGEPFAERIVMWWNFVGRDHDDIATARAEWAAAAPRFGSVRGYPGDPLPAPALPSVRLRSRGRSG